MRANYIPDVVITDNDAPIIDLRGSADLATLITAIGAVDKRIILISEDQTIGANVTVPANIKLMRSNGATLNISAGYTLTFSGTDSIIGGNGEFFIGAGSISFASGSVVYLSWFASLTSALDFISAANVSLMFDTTSSISIAETIPATTSCIFPYANKEITAGANDITFNGEVSADDFTIIIGSGTYTFSKNTIVHNIWTGGTQDVTFANDVSITKDLTVLGAFALTGSITSAAGNITLTAGTLSAAALVSTGGVTVTGNYNSTAGNITLVGGDIALTNGAIDLTNGNLTVAAGVLTGNSLVVTNGATIGTTLAVTSTISCADPTTDAHVGDRGYNDTRYQSNVTQNSTVNRTRFEYVDADEIYLYPAAYHHKGTVGGEQFLYWDTRLSYQYTSLVADEWSYLYIDDSAITPLTSLITASELTDSLSAPTLTYSLGKYGLYNGQDRCIGASYGTGINTQKKFYHSSYDYIEWDNDKEIFASADVDTAWEDVTAIAPAFCRQIKAWAYQGNGGSADARMSARVKGSGGNGRYITATNSSGAWDSSEFTQSINSDLEFEVVCDRSSNDTLEISQTGWYFPIGM